MSIKRLIIYHLILDIFKSEKEATITSYYPIYFVGTASFVNQFGRVMSTRSMHYYTQF